MLGSEGPSLRRVKVMGGAATTDVREAEPAPVAGVFTAFVRRRRRATDGYSTAATRF
jgi:hypothetical protein